MTGGVDRGWHVGKWGPLGWAETVLKSAGVIVGIGALVAVRGAEADWAPGWRLAQVVVLGLLCVGLVAAIADRLAERELVGIVFIVAMTVGHLCMTLALARADDLGLYLVAFCVLMIAGDLIKLVFLRTTGFRVRDIDPAVVHGLVITYLVGYAVVLALQVP
jgi:hypothetical protein